MAATDTYLLLRAFCQELARCGLDQACTSPGSRCTPIVLSLVRAPGTRCYSHIDERCAGFFALGAAKASGRPVAVTCTSGTAAANLLPAVVEAHHARVPLIVLTADRPPELREVGAGQTIDQERLYGGAVKWFFEVGVHDATPARLRWMRTLACRAYWTALESPSGPVHLNLPLREPLVLDEPLPDDQTARADGRAYVVWQKAPSVGTAGDAVHPSGRIVVVAGAASPAELPELAARSQVPLLADPLSGARHGPAAIAHYDLLLRNRGFTDAHRPQFVVRLGDLPTSKPLRQWLAGLDDIAQIAFDPDVLWHDPDSVVGLRIAGSSLPGADAAGEPGWLDSWRSADAAASRAIEHAVGSELSEPFVARALADWLPSQATLFVASSMPIRDIEEFAGVRPDAPRVLSNRGANGIDGTVSSAFGVAAGARGPVVLLVGDVALAHDIGGLLSARRLGIPLTVVVLNNDGGGIFHFLPVAAESDAFEEHVATPHGLNFEQVASLYGCSYERPRTAAELRSAVMGSVGVAATTIVEVRTGREENLVLHRRVADAVSAALAGLEGGSAVREAEKRKA
jgi:2-succinyl-5-enolpyruvyl-6-hydroxy-3-cyclohexene-1-carboxylate synthase